MDRIIKLQAVLAEAKTLTELDDAQKKLKCAIKHLQRVRNVKKARQCKINDRFTPATPVHPEVIDIGIDDKHDVKYEGRGRKCYICKHRFTDIHHFYHAMCQECGDKNHEKRLQTADMTGKVTIVTGGRIKIGYETALKLLRAGADVIVTTRFPTDATQRYSKEKDYDAFKDRLIIYKLDLLNADDITAFVEFVKSEVQHIDILINNAAQTIARPNEYYNSLLGKDVFTHDFPDAVDENGIQIDMRAKNTWVTRMAETETKELIGVTMINYIAPYLLLKSFHELLKATEDSPSHVINVSSMEGKFTTTMRFKTDRHVHSNCAKAALNMITRSLAFGWQQDHILVNSVETGWITDEFPGDGLTDFLPPLDETDGAARILDPVFTNQKIKNSKDRIVGLFLKDYCRISW
jgi:NAD(P)-dependent dehydrogenase (short-subunit alcohol dehydrogenase family)